MSDSYHFLSKLYLYEYSEWSKRGMWHQRVDRDHPWLHSPDPLTVNSLNTVLVRPTHSGSWSELTLLTAPTFILASVNKFLALGSVCVIQRNVALVDSWAWFSGITSPDRVMLCCSVMKTTIKASSNGVSIFTTVNYREIVFEPKIWEHQSDGMMAMASLMSLWVSLRCWQADSRRASNPSNVHSSHKILAKWSEPSYLLTPLRKLRQH